MQIIIELDAKDEGIVYSTSKEKRKKEILNLSNLISKLKADGYYINTLYGRFVFDEAEKEVIDVGEKGEIANCSSREFADCIFKSEGKLAIIFTDKKYVVFADKYFVAIYFCHMRKVRPISILDTINNYDELINKENKNLLSKLYLKKFGLYYGNDSNAKSYLLNDNTLRTERYEVGDLKNNKK